MAAAAGWVLPAVSREEATAAVVAAEAGRP